MLCIILHHKTAPLNQVEAYSARMHVDQGEALPEPGLDIERHRTAIGRTTLSRPVKAAVLDGLLTEETSFFDYGCGRGDDLRILSTMGFAADGWDPVYRSEADRQRAEVVNLGYVVNVIESPAERREALKGAWELAERVLVVSARLAGEERTLADPDDYADGVVTTRRTFQKFFEQQELKNWLDQTLQTPAIPAAPGIFYVFRDEELRTDFQAARFRRRIAIPRLARPVADYEEHRELLQPLVDFMAAHGRLPVEEELANVSDVIETFGGIGRAFRIIEKATDTQDWDEIAEERAQDLLIYLALARFEQRPAFSALAAPMQRDVKSFFRTYKAACAEADELLFSLGDVDSVSAECAASPIGKVTQEALYVHESALDRLRPRLRLFEGCARNYIGRVEGANLVKLNRRAPKVSYLAYPDFDDDPHPALAFSLSVDLQTFRQRTRDYRDFRNPPILHRKETFVCSDYPQFDKFARLTRLEDAKGLYETPTKIGTREGWEACLKAAGWTLRGHRLIRVASQ